MTSRRAYPGFHWVWLALLSALIGWAPSALRAQSAAIDLPDIGSGADSTLTLND